MNESRSTQPNPRVGQTLGLITQEHPQPLSASKEPPFCVLPDHIRKQEEKAYVFGATQPHSSMYRNAVDLLELMSPEENNQQILGEQALDPNGFAIRGMGE